MRSPVESKSGSLVIVRSSLSLLKATHVISAIRIARRVSSRFCNSPGFQQQLRPALFLSSGVPLVESFPYLRWMIDIRLTFHAMERMAQREIAYADIESALMRQVLSFTTRQGSLQIIGRTSSGRLLKVWGLEPPVSGVRFTIKTVAWKE